jgi:hypothetical protein
MKTALMSGAIAAPRGSLQAAEHIVDCPDAILFFMIESMSCDALLIA